MTARRCRFMWQAGTVERACYCAALALTLLAFWLVGVK